MGIRTILIVEAAHADKLSIVASQMGYTQNFGQGVRLCAFGTSATSATPPTHYLVNDAQMASGMEQNFRLMASGDYLPQVVWGDIDGITEQEANDAAEALQVVSEAGGDLGNLDTILQAKSLKRVPEVSI